MPTKHDMVPLSRTEKQVLLGGILGDGSVKKYKNYKTARYAFRHSEIQSEYFYWKARELKNLASENSTHVQERNSAGNRMLRFQTLALPSIESIYLVTTENNEKSIRREWLNKLDPLGLAVWWMDDGSLIGNTTKGVFCTDSFSYEEQVILQRYLAEEWDIEVRIKPVKGREGHNRLHLTSVRELKKLLRVIIPVIPVESMLYKVLVLYKHLEYQQRWVSEVAKLSQFDTSVIEKVIEERKTRLKHFRK